MKSYEIQNIINDIRFKVNNNIKINDDEYIDFKKNYENLYKISIKKEFDIKQFNFFLYKLKQIEENKISQHDASVAIGSVLVDKYVKPEIKK